MSAAALERPFSFTSHADGAAVLQRGRTSSVRAQARLALHVRERQEPARRGWVSTTACKRRASLAGVQSLTPVSLLSGREYFIDSSANQLLFIPPNGEDLSQPAADGLGVFLSKEEHAHSMDGASSIVLQVHFLCSVLVSEASAAILSQRA